MPMRGPMPGAIPQPYRTLTKQEAGRQPDPIYDRQRFDNYTAWLDAALRSRQEAQKVFGAQPRQDLQPAGMPTQQKKPLYGFTQSTPDLARTPRSEPFFIREPTFTSGVLMRRAYDRCDSITSQSVPLKATRTDPWHYPNTQAVEEKEHYGDYRSTSRSENAPKNRPMDFERAAQVPEEMVKQWVASNSGAAQDRNFSKTSAAVLFGAVDLAHKASPTKTKREKERALETRKLFARVWGWQFDKSASVPVFARTFR